MIGTKTWSYQPYTPFFFDGGDIYVCRVAPGRDTIHMEWLDAPGKDYCVYLRKEGKGDFSLAAQVTVPECTLTDLETETDYEFYVSCGEKKSRVRLARTGEAVGVVINYMHPRDDAYKFSGRYLCSPSLLRLPDGYC